MRKKVMAEKQQQQVWDEVSRSKNAMAMAGAPLAQSSVPNYGYAMQSPDSTTSLRQSPRKPNHSERSGFDWGAQPMEKSYARG
ncbi:MAG TPA: hypothetical protein VKT33_09945 [Candidatus Angelobacter sp.]|nr:hypothetical protein [Candidatus Angelobacter sp.]